MPINREFLENFASNFGLGFVDFLDDPYDNFQLSSELSWMATIHEISHYQVCSKPRRNLTNFGLGINKGFNRSVDKKDCVLSEHDHFVEEMRASVLTTCWLTKKLDLGVQPILFPWHGKMVQAGIFNFQLRSEIHAISWLKKNGIIDRNMIPTYKINVNENEDHRSCFSGFCCNENHGITCSQAANISS